VSNMYGRLKYIYKLLLKVIGYGVIVFGVAFVGVIYGYYVFVIKPAKRAEVTAIVLTQESPYKETFKLCADAYTTKEMDNCSQETLRIIDEVNLNYFKKAIEGLQPREDGYAGIGDDFVAAADALRKSRQSFSSFRDELCDSQYWSAGGTRRNNVHSNCMEVVTKQYTLYIWQAYMSWKGESHYDDFPEPTFNSDMLF